MEEIAQRFDITRERVRQIVGNVDNVNFATIRKTAKARQLPELTNEELANKLGVTETTVSKYRSGMRHAVKRGKSSVYVHYQAEEKAIELLEKRGFVVQAQPIKEKFNLLVNRWAKVQVVVASNPNDPPSSNLISPQWKFAVREGDWDFMFCITGEDDVFIIPRTAIPRNFSNLAFCYPTQRPTLGKYQIYKDQYDQLIRR